MSYSSKSSDRWIFGIHWVLTLIPTVCLITIFAESLRAMMLLGEMPGRYVGLTDEESDLLRQDWLFQRLGDAIDAIPRIMMFGFLFWLIITPIGMARIAKSTRNNRFINSFRYLLIHCFILILPIVIFFLEPTKRAVWLFN